MSKPILMVVVMVCMLHATAGHTQRSGTPDVPPAAASGAPTVVVVRRIGGAVSAPVVLVAPGPVISEESKKLIRPLKPYEGKVLVYLQVDPTGLPIHIRVLRGVGLGLDESAVEAVRQYRFKPAMENGQPVTIEMNVEVVFKVI